MSSPYALKFGAATNPALEQLRVKIKDAKLMPSECVCQVENVTVNGEIKTIRRVFPVEHSYQIGHHCRACGNLVCAECSPYKTRITSISDEETMSRVCLNCFGLKVTVQDPVEYQKKMELITFENNQRPINFEAYRTMRRVIPPNITRTTYPKLKELDIPETILTRIWNTKILWIICMHKDDILKIHVADLRSRFATTGLDLTEMRAIWYNLPDWTIDPKDFLKQEWKQGFRDKMQNMIDSELNGTLSEAMTRHPAYKGYEDLVIFKPDAPLKKLFVGIHSTESQLPVIREDSRRGSLGSNADSDEEVEEEDELKEYMYSDGREKSAPAADSAVIGDGPFAQPLSAGISFLGYLANMATPRPTQRRDTRASINLPGDRSPSQDLNSSIMSDMGPSDADIDQDMATWDFEMGSDHGSQTSPKGLGEHRSFAFQTTTPAPSALLIRRAQTYPVEDDSEMAITLDSPRGLGRDDLSLRTVSMRFEPSSDDKSLKEWKSPNLTPNSSTRTPFKGAPAPARTLTRKMSLSRDEIDFDDELDKELDEWKVPAKIDELLEDLNDEEVELDMIPPTSTTKARGSSTFLPVKPPRRSINQSSSVIQVHAPLRSSMQPPRSRPSSTRVPLAVVESSPMSVDSKVEEELTLSDVDDEVVSYPDLSADSFTITRDRRDDSIGSITSEEQTGAEEPAEEQPAPKRKSFNVAEEIQFSTFSPFNRNPSRVFLAQDVALPEPPLSPVRATASNDEVVVMKEHLLEAIRSGDAYNARLMALNNAVLQTEMSHEEASRVLPRCLKHIDAMAQPLETIRLLVETFKADVNYRDVKSGTGDNALMLCMNRPDIGRYLMSKGADIFMKNRNGLSPLSASIPQNNFWLVEEFADSEEEAKVFQDPDETRMREYVSWLMFAGYGSKLKQHLAKGDVAITAAQAAILYSQCSENFGNMKEPVETYELLEKLMASAL